MFQCSLLARQDGEKLRVSDLCHWLASDTEASSNDYFFFVTNHFRLPFPAFNNYNETAKRVYPYCAILKFLLARRHTGTRPSISLDEALQYVVANDCTGLEPLSYYAKLRARPTPFTDIERRQVRELLLFISQLSFLEVFEGQLVLDVESEAQSQAILSALSPWQRAPEIDRTAEFFALSATSGIPLQLSLPQSTATAVDYPLVQEGERCQRMHYSIERSPIVRTFYPKAHPEPICQACHNDMSEHYPWTDYLLDIHHLLPLSSPLRITLRGTSLTDVVGLCPTCHRAIHMFYRQWLHDQGHRDFATNEEARHVYQLAVSHIV